MLNIICTAVSSSREKQIGETKYMLEGLEWLGLSMGHSSLKPRQKEGRSWTAASEGYSKSGEVRVVISLVFVGARVSFSWPLSSHTGNLEKSNTVNDCLKKQDQELLFPAKLQCNTEGSQAYLCVLIQVKPHWNEYLKPIRPDTPSTKKKRSSNTFIS